MNGLSTSLPAPVQLALSIPAPASKQAEAKPAAKLPGASVRDMAQRAKAAVMSIASHEKPTMVEKLWGKQPSQGSLLSYASADVSATGSVIDARAQNPMLGGSPPYDKQTAVYDISAKTVYLPDGTKLEAHSGLGAKMDDPKYSHVRMQGVTPPHIYELTPREALFHGVPALRLNPIGGEEKIFGRTGSPFNLQKPLDWDYPHCETLPLDTKNKVGSDAVKPASFCIAKDLGDACRLFCEWVMHFGESAKPPRTGGQSRELWDADRHQEI